MKNCFRSVNRRLPNKDRSGSVLTLVIVIGALLAMISADGDTNHYCLVNGYDASTEAVFLLDPRRGSIGMSAPDFERLWEEARRFTLLATPASAASRPLMTNKETTP